MKKSFLSSVCLMIYLCIISCTKNNDIVGGDTGTVPPVQKGLVIHHANTGQCYGKDITVDNQDNFIIAELFQGSINGKPFTSAGIIDALFAKHDKNGNIIWEKTAGGAGFGLAIGVFIGAIFDFVKNRE